MLKLTASTTPTLNLTLLPPQRSSAPLFTVYTPENTQAVDAVAFAPRPPQPSPAEAR